MFKHVITRDVAYELMLRAQRRELHRAIAEWYERHHAAELPRFYPLLAYHWSRTGMAAKAVQYQGLAGEQALAGGAYQEAVLFLTAALERDPPPPQDGNAEARFRRARWERQLAEAHLGLGETGEGRVQRAADAVGAALGDGVPVLGAFHLPAIDGYECLRGFDARLGLFDRDRNPKVTLGALVPIVP